MAKRHLAKKGKTGFRTSRKFISLRTKAIKKWKAKVQPKLKKQ